VLVEILMSLLSRGWRERAFVSCSIASVTGSCQSFPLLVEPIGELRNENRLGSRFKGLTCYALYASQL